MCVLHCALLEDNNDCYDFNSGIFFEETLAEKMRRLKSIYQPELITIFECMLSSQESDRMTFGEFYEYLKSKDHCFTSQRGG